MLTYKILQGADASQLLTKGRIFFILLQLIFINDRASMTADNLKKLSELKPGEAGEVVRVLGDGPFRQRLLEMGLTRGVRVEMEKTAPLGDPTEYVVKGYHLSLRRGEAELILLRPLSEDE